MQNGMEKPAVNIGSTAPAPTNPSRRTWMIVESATTTNEANTIQVTYESPSFEAFATITGVTSSVAEAIRLNCSPYPTDASRGGDSSAS